MKKTRKEMIELRNELLDISIQYKDYEIKSHQLTLRLLKYIGEEDLEKEHFSDKGLWYKSYRS